MCARTNLKRAACRALWPCLHAAARLLLLLLEGNLYLWQIAPLEPPSAPFTLNPQHDISLYQLVPACTELLESA